MLWYPSCSGWHGTSAAEWIPSSAFGLIRGESGVFSFSYSSGPWGYGDGCGRGVAVVKSAVRA